MSKSVQDDGHTSSEKALLDARSVVPERDLATEESLLSSESEPEPQAEDDYDRSEKVSLIGRSKDFQDGPAKEYTVATKKKISFLAVWFTLNLLLTLYNKAIFAFFPFPWALTSIHALCVSLGCYGLLASGWFKLSKLNTQENAILFAYSFLYTINIAVSNVSLHAVSVPFHQTMRSIGPAFTVLIYFSCFSRSYSTATYLSLIPIMLGVALATYGDYHFTPMGFLLTLLGVVLAAVKTIVSNRLMTGDLALPPLEILLRMSPLAALQAAAYCYATGELARLHTSLVDERLGLLPTLFILGNGLMAFMLNVSSLQTNKMAGALTLSVAGNLKQCLTIVLGIVLFSVKVTPLNGIGMFISVLGGAIYSKVELDAKQSR